MKTIKVRYGSDIPENFTGVAEFPDGSKHWLKERKYHRLDGPAIEEVNGSKEWWIEGKLHREDGPAIISTNGSKYWYKEGKSHREDGPAIERKDGTKHWFLNGIRYTQINLNDYVILDYSEGEYGLMWYKLLDKEEILEYPDIPGLVFGK